MPRDTRKSLRSTSRFTRILHVANGFLFPDENKKNVLQSLRNQFVLEHCLVCILDLKRVGASFKRRPLSVQRDREPCKFCLHLN